MLRSATDAHLQGCSGAGARWSAIPANIFEPGNGALVNIVYHRWNVDNLLALLVSYFMHEIWPIGSRQNH